MTTNYSLAIREGAQKIYNSLEYTCKATSTRWEALDRQVTLITHTYCNRALAHIVQRAFRSLPLVCISALLPFPWTLGGYYGFTLLLLANPNCYSEKTLSYVHDGGGFYSMAQVVRSAYVFVKTLSPLYLIKGLVWSGVTFYFFRSPPRIEEANPPCCVPPIQPNNSVTTHG
jgi:hypothetical protein